MGWFDTLAPVDRLPVRAGGDLGLVERAARTGRSWSCPGILWLGLPLAIGIWRVLRAEVK